jgi:putative ABC transport system permease protein
MNIMLVSVTERTREIGLRLAIGARIRDIRAQFMVEALLLGLLGGVLGVSLGWAASEVLTGRLGWPALISADAIGAAVATAAGTGLFFGYYPAHRASALDPIDALRVES